MALPISNFAADARPAAPPLGPEPVLNLRSRVAYIKVAVDDLDKAAAFYTRQMGMQEFSRSQVSDGIQEMLLGYERPTRQNAAIGLIAVKYPAQPATPTPTDAPRGYILSKVVFATSDFNALAARAESRGYATTRTQRAAFIVDPTGNVVELIASSDLPDVQSTPQARRIVCPKLVASSDPATAEFYTSLLGMKETASSRFVHKQLVRELVFAYDPAAPYVGVITSRYPADFHEVFDEGERFILPNVVIRTPMAGAAALGKFVRDAGSPVALGLPVNVMDPSGNIIEAVDLPE